MLLIRDWGCPEEFSYGDEGGSRYVDMQLEVRYSLQRYILGCCYVLLRCKERII